jgi:hypothetical protein
MREDDLGEKGMGNVLSVDCGIGRMETVLGEG